MSDLRFLGHASPASIEAGDLETVPLTRHSVSTVTVSGHELQALCPVTGQPDLYDFLIMYDPAGRVLESKALKLYLVSWRDKGIMCEPLAAAIAQDLTAAAGTPVTVVLTQQARGGLVIEATAEGSTP